MRIAPYFAASTILRYSQSEGRRLIGFGTQVWIVDQQLTRSDSAPGRLSTRPGWWRTIRRPLNPPTTTGLQWPENAMKAALPGPIEVDNHPDFGPTLASSWHGCTYKGGNQ
jgi:hypothetical protein